MSSTNSQTNTSKEDNKEAPPKPAAEKPAPPKPAAEKPEEVLPAFEKEFTDRIVNQFTDDVEVGYLSLIHI